MFKTIEWTEQGVRMIEQTRLHAEDLDCCLRVVHDSHRLEVGVVGLGLRFGMVLFQRSGETRRLANLGGESFWDADKSRLAPEAGVGGILNRRGRLRRVGWQRAPYKKGELDDFMDHPHDEQKQGRGRTQVIAKSLLAISAFPMSRCESGHTAVGGAPYAAQPARRSRK
jgi:hypothetical protein